MARALMAKNKPIIALRLRKTPGQSGLRRGGQNPPGGTPMRVSGGAQRKTGQSRLYTRKL